MKKIIISILLIVSTASILNSGVCVSKVDPENNGSCELEMEYNAETESWELTGAFCMMLARNAFGVHDCMILTTSTLPPGIPALHPA